MSDTILTTGLNGHQAMGTGVSLEYSKIQEKCHICGTTQDLRPWSVDGRKACLQCCKDYYDDFIVADCGEVNEGGG